MILAPELIILIINKCSYVTLIRLLFMNSNLTLFIKKYSKILIFNYINPSIGEKLREKYKISQNINSNMSIRGRFIYGCGYGLIKMVKSCFNVKNKDHNNRGLQSASKFGHLDIVKYLISKGSIVDVNSDLSSALRNASENGHLRVVICLVKNGANIHAKQSDALKLAIKNNHLLIIRYLIKMGAEYGPEYLCFSERHNKLDSIRYLTTTFEHSIYYLNIALARAFQCGNYGVAKFLIKIGANVNSRFPNIVHTYH